MRMAAHGCAANPCKGAAAALQPRQTQSQAIWVSIELRRRARSHSTALGEPVAMDRTTRGL